jgi:hypothetical protein
MQQDTDVLFARAVDEFARWRTVPEHVRSPAPAWWWGTAFERRNERRPMREAWCAILELADGATYADGARVFLDSLADQTSLPWPAGFPGQVVDPQSADSRSADARGASADGSD